MKKLRILSLARNNLKKIEKLEENAATLEELWVSYNDILSCDGMASLTKLRTLYMSNNRIKTIDELNKLSGLTELRDVLFKGNPFADEFDSVPDYRVAVLKILPQVSKIDGTLVTPDERSACA